MKLRTHDHLFAAAGVTAALSLIGTGATVLNGSVFEFSGWPLVSGEQSHTVQLPVAPQTIDRQAASAQQRLAQATGGTRFSGLDNAIVTGPGVRTLSFTLPSGAQAISPLPAGTRVPGSSSGARTRVSVNAGSDVSLGDTTSSASDGSHDPITTDPTSAPRTVSGGTDLDGDGVPDSWSSPTGGPTAGSDAVSADQDARGRDSSQTAFVAETPTDPAAETPADTPTTDTAPAPQTPAPAPETPAPAPADPTPADPAPADPAPTADPAPADPAPASDPAPADPAPADPTPDPAPTADPAPADPAPADPAPAASTPDPAPTADPAPADPAPADPAPAPTPTATAPEQTAPVAAQTAPAADDEHTPANSAIPCSAR